MSKAEDSSLYQLGQDPCPVRRFFCEKCRKRQAIIVNLDITNDFWKQSASNDSCR
ncbi:MAG: hypothetical protein OEZ48_17380 [Candidatus Bathyarchaeota archaeon]|nr:hypothetical protein [Candidatus Bathyarchaeota archaeon]